jgi:hypothetical protein
MEYDASKEHKRLLRESLLRAASRHNIMCRCQLCIKVGRGNRQCEYDGCTRSLTMIDDALCATHHEEVHPHVRDRHVW